MNARQPFARALLEVFAADPGLALDLYGNARDLVDSLERLRGRVLIEPAPHATESLALRLSDGLESIERRMFSALTLRQLISEFSTQEAAEVGLRVSELSTSVEPSAGTLSSRLLLDLPSRTRSDEGPLFDGLELAPLAPPDASGVVESLSSINEIPVEDRDRTRWALFGHVSGRGCVWICDFESADAALEVLRSLLGDLREKPTALG